MRAISRRSCWAIARTSAVAAREPLEVVGLGRPEVHFVPRPVADRHGHRLAVRGLAPHGRAQDQVGRELEAHRGQPAQHVGVAPARGRAQFADAVPLAPLRERVEQQAPAADAACALAQAHHLQAQGGPAAAEFAFQHAREDVAGQARLVARRELRVQRGFAQRGCQAALDVGAARPPFEGGVDGHDQRQVVGRERSDGERGGAVDGHGSAPFGLTHRLA